MKTILTKLTGVLALALMMTVGVSAPTGAAGSTTAIPHLEQLDGPGGAPTARLVRNRPPAADATDAHTRLIAVRIGPRPPTK